MTATCERVACGCAYKWIGIKERTAICPAKQQTWRTWCSRWTVGHPVLSVHEASLPEKVLQGR
eukprot:1812482-Prymnesium_polylepis.1